MHFNIKSTEDWNIVIARSLGRIRRQGADHSMGKGDWFNVRSRRSADPRLTCSSDCLKLQLFLQLG